MKKTINGRSVYINTKKTQTINICYKTNERGKYENIYRLKGRSVIEETQLDKIIDSFSLDDLKKWLENLVENGKALKELPRSFVNNYDPNKDKWLERAIDIVEQTIDKVLDDFIQFPYLHRVEHSFHTCLIEKFRQFPELNQNIKIGDEETQLIHKEWPENVAWRGTRGNFDIVILSPTQFYSIPKPNIDDFSKGIIPPPIVIECGLNYNIKHLNDDLDKIIKNSPKYGYIVHLVRDSADEQEIIEKDDIFKKANDKGYKIAYVYIDGKNVNYKYLDDLKIKNKTR
jgi:hypothetical protein